MNYLSNVGVGADIARKQQIGESTLKQLDAQSELAVVGGVKTFESPSGLSGQVAIPSSIQAAQTFQLFIDTTGKDKTSNVMLFDPKDIHKNSMSCNGCGSDGEEAQAKIYLERPDCNLYDSLVSMLCGRKYVISSMRMEVRATTDNENKAGIVHYPNISVNRMNLSGDQESLSIKPSLHKSTSQFVQNIIDIPLTGKASLLDEFTAWKLSVAKGLLVELTLTVSLRSK